MQAVKNEEPQVEETIKESKKTRIKRYATIGAVAGAYVGTVAAGVGSAYLGWKVTKMKYETAKLDNETAKINADVQE